MVLAILQKIEKYLSIHLEVLLLYIEIILKIILNLSKSVELACMIYTVTKCQCKSGVRQ